MTPPVGNKFVSAFVEWSMFQTATWSAGSENRPTTTYSFGINTLVGEDIILPPGHKTECLVEWYQCGKLVRIRLTFLRL